MRQRLAYLCDYFFASDVRAFALALDQDIERLQSVLYRNRAVTVRLVAQVIRQLNVRSEWLLHGIGTILSSTTENGHPPAFQLPDSFSSSFALFDPYSATHGLAKDMNNVRSAAQEAALFPPQASHFSLAIAIHSARSHGAPVLACLGDAAINSGAGASVCDMLHKKYVTGVALTGAAAAADVRLSRPSVRPDMNFTAKLAATQGLGYGEAVARWGFAPDARREKSVICSAHASSAPITVHAEVGELAEHLYAAARGAELGAAVGAATYVDLLVFTEQVRSVLSEGGVVVVVSAADRFLKLVMQAAQAAETTLSETANFCVGVVDRFFSEEDFAAVEQYGGIGCALQGSCSSNVLNILQACDAVYSGSIPNEFKK